MANGSIGLFVSAVVLVAIVGSNLWNKDDLKRYQQLKNKSRFGGKRLPAAEQEELNSLSKILVIIVGVQMRASSISPPTLSFHRTAFGGRLIQTS